MGLNFKGLTFNKDFGNISNSQEEAYVVVGCLGPTQRGQRQIYFLKSKQRGYEKGDGYENTAG